MDLVCASIWFGGYGRILLLSSDTPHKIEWLTLDSALWTAGTRDAWGRTTSATLSNQVVQGVTVDAQTGRMERLTAATGTRQV